METYKNDKLLTRLVCRLTKAGSSYFYFTLESNEGLAFYSTLNESIDEDHRDILIHSPIELTQHLDHLINECQKFVEIQVISREVIEDGPDCQLQL